MQDKIPLPLDDNNVLHIDNSMLELLQTCPRSLEYNRLRKRIPATTKPSLEFGTAIHAALDYRYRTFGSQKVDAAGEYAQTTLLEEFFRGATIPEDDFRNLNWAQEVIVKQYNQRYGVEPFSILSDEHGKPFVELSFSIPWFYIEPTYQNVTPFDTHKLPPTSKHILICYSGRIDLVVLQKNKVTIIDHKTTSILGQGFWDDHRVSPQQLGYCWAFWRSTGIMPHEFLINAIRVRQLPSRAPVGGYATWWEESFHRDGDYITPDKLSEWETNTTTLIQEMFWHHSRDFMPQKKKWCCAKYGRCGYYDVCSLPTTQRPEMLSSNLFTDNTWSPLKKT